MIFELTEQHLAEVLYLAVRNPGEGRMYGELPPGLKRPFETKARAALAEMRRPSPAPAAVGDRLPGKLRPV